MKQKTICFDYDKTVTSFPELMLMWMRTAKAAGHRVILCTMRYPDEEDSGIEFIRTIIDGVYFSSETAKLPYLSSLNIHPDLWIDDCPRWILNDAYHDLE